MILGGFKGSKYFTFFVFNILTRHNQDVTELKFLWPVNMTQIILTPLS